LIPGFPDQHRLYCVGFSPAEGVARYRYESWLNMSLDVETFNRMLAQSAFPKGLIFLQPRVGSFVIMGDETVTRKALLHLRNSYQGALWWPVN